MLLKESKSRQEQKGMVGVGEGRAERVRQRGNDLNYSLHYHGHVILLMNSYDGTR